MTHIEKLREALIAECKDAKKEIEFMKEHNETLNRMIINSYIVLSDFSKEQIITLLISYRIDKVNSIVDKILNIRQVAQMVKSEDRMKNTLLSILKTSKRTLQNIAELDNDIAEGIARANKILQKFKKQDIICMFLATTI